MGEQIKTFPSGKIEALTMLYLQSQKLDGTTPEQLAKLYSETYSRIKSQFFDEKRETRGVTG